MLFLTFRDEKRQKELETSSKEEAILITSMEVVILQRFKCIHWKSGRDKSTCSSLWKLRTLHYISEAVELLIRLHNQCYSNKRYLLETVGYVLVIPQRVVCTKERNQSKCRFCKQTHHHSVAYHFSDDITRYFTESAARLILSATL
ncbi:hypothetical protein Trydic_g18483 [Trypoxylus dichotomus]